MYIVSRDKGDNTYEVIKVSDDSREIHTLESLISLQNNGHTVRGLVNGRVVRTFATFEDYARYGYTKAKMTGSPYSLELIDGKCVLFGLLKKDLKHVSIPDFVWRISSNAFQDTHIESVVIPSSVREIGMYTFNGISELKSVKLSEGLTLIELRAFASCTNLETIQLPRSLQNISTEAFQSSGLHSIEIPDGVKHTGEYCFDDCSNLTRVVFNSPDLLELDHGTFSYCKKLEYVELPENLVILRNNCFNECISLQTVELPDTLEYIGYGAFQKSGIKSLELPSTVTGVSTKAFVNCNNLTNISVPKDIVHFLSLDCEAKWLVKFLKTDENGEYYIDKNDFQTERLANNIKVKLI